MTEVSEINFGLFKPESDEVKDALEVEIVSNTIISL